MGVIFNRNKDKHVKYVRRGYEDVDPDKVGYNYKESVKNNPRNIERREAQENYDIAKARREIQREEQKKLMVQKQRESFNRVTRHVDEALEKRNQSVQSHRIPTPDNLGQYDPKNEASRAGVSKTISHVKRFSSNKKRSESKPSHHSHSFFSFMQSSDSPKSSKVKMPSMFSGGGGPGLSLFSQAANKPPGPGLSLFNTGGSRRKSKPPKIKLW